jgi:hypothetical protein
MAGAICCSYSDVFVSQDLFCFYVSSSFCDIVTLLFFRHVFYLFYLKKTPGYPPSTLNTFTDIPLQLLTRTA